MKRNFLMRRNEKVNLETKLKQGQPILNGHASCIYNVTGVYFGNVVPDLEFIKIYNLLFDETQAFETEAEKFIFESDKRLYLIYSNTKQRPEVGDLAVSLISGFNSGSSSANLRVTEIDEGKNQIYLCPWSDKNDTKKFLIEYRKWAASIYIIKLESGEPGLVNKTKEN
jgi:hypothetical protein